MRVITLYCLNLKHIVLRKVSFSLIFFFCKRCSYYQYWDKRILNPEILREITDYSNLFFQTICFLILCVRICMNEKNIFVTCIMCLCKKRRYFVIFLFRWVILLFFYFLLFLQSLLGQVRLEYICKSDRWYKITSSQVFKHFLSKRIRSRNETVAAAKNLLRKNARNTPNASFQKGNFQFDRQLL